MYSFEHIVNECVAEKAANVAPDAKKDMYIESFEALNCWIESRLSKRKVCLIVVHIRLKPRNDVMFFITLK